MRPWILFFLDIVEYANLERFQVFRVDLFSGLGVIDLDTRDFARSFSRELLLRYRGYLPTAQGLKEVLDEPCRLFIGKEESFDDAFRRFTRSAGLRVIFENDQTPNPRIGNDKTIEMKTKIQ